MYAVLYWPNIGFWPKGLYTRFYCSLQSCMYVHALQDSVYCSVFLQWRRAKFYIMPIDVLPCTFVCANNDDSVVANNDDHSVLFFFQLRKGKDLGINGIVYAS